MPIEIAAHFSLYLPDPGDLLLQFEAATIPEQRILSAETIVSPDAAYARVPAQDAIGERIWLRAQGPMAVSYRATVEIVRQLADIPALERLPMHLLPGETVQYLLPSLYCPSIRFQNFADAEFGSTQGGARIEAIRRWISERFTYEPGSSNAMTSALDSIVERRGICRDYAHVLVTLARASGIPARYVSVYATGVEPPDFHAVAEVFLADTQGESGAWHLVDATGMAAAGGMAKIGVGRDAADVSFITCFSDCQFENSTVSVKTVDG